MMSDKSTDDFGAVLYYYDEMSDDNSSVTTPNEALTKHEKAHRI